jgi:RNA polymerase sigma-70 factor (ECF subfamily)
LTDERLVQAAQRGDQHAFGELVARYRPYVYTIAYKILLNIDDALDVTQEVFMRVAQRIGSYDGRGNFSSWIAAVTAREAISERRRAVRREIALEDVESMQPAEKLRASEEYFAFGQPDAREVLERQWKRERIDAAMVSLSQQQRAILSLMLREDMGPHEVAVALDIGESQVRSQLHRAVIRIRELCNSQPAAAKRDSKEQPI